MKNPIGIFRVGRLQEGVSKGPNRPVVWNTNRTKSRFMRGWRSKQESIRVEMTSQLGNRSIRDAFANVENIMIKKKRVLTNRCKNHYTSIYCLHL